ncbi:vascular endothelial growth factor receptor 3 isoform X1 [Mycetomoellerius zeteki]|uniref:vascular endothelial growth factor receptor 3 isoform X1 n=1 Tax=Mycetomoellerius zeteki TaxID=64791 RepID=UPI00084EBEC6|nr:PREDICTED: vascular endothelial growth factor receptor 3-like isoform X1 [Trachymyrmex zeteki]
MFIQCKYILIYDIIIVWLLYSDTICANVKNVTKFAGVVENITVHVSENESYFKNDNVLKSLKLNVSWTPPNGEKEPSSYSVMITSMLKETDINRTECTEGLALYNVQNKSQFSILVPQDKLLNGISDIQIHPNCTYKIQVYANPRVKPIGKLPEVIYRVPECIRHKCSCADAKSILPIPKVEVIRAREDVVINWNITSNNSHIHSYIISVGIPLLISKTGHSVYNITKISNVTSTINTFNWNMRIDDQYVKVKNGYKILVAAMDYRNCLGTQGGYTIVDISKTKILDRSAMWLLLAGIVICVILGFISIISIHNKNGYQLVFPFRRKHFIFNDRRQTVSDPSACKLAQWPDPVFQRRNIDVYVEQKSEGTCYKVQKDEFEVPYKYINFIYELGKGQFGKVYLGSLNNKNILVAVKMSQCSDACNEFEARHQLLEEIKIMKAAGSHTHLVSLIGCCTLPNNPICILLEYMEGGDLLAYLHYRRKFKSDDQLLYSVEKAVSKYTNIVERNKNVNENLYDTIDNQQFIKFALDIARGMEHLEAKEIIHRDLAARNILLTSDRTLKISDFGLSRNGIYVINNMAGKIRQLPIRWMSPEAICDHAFSSKSDVWSFGVVLWEIGTLGSFPYASIQDNELLRYLIQDKCRLTCPNTVSHNIYKVMCCCWNMVPQDRPSFAQLVLDLQILKKSLHSMHDASNPCYALHSY